MKLYTCSKCGNPLYFENTSCVTCEHKLGFDPLTLELVTLTETGKGLFADINARRKKYKFCANHQYNACNWLIPANDKSDLCIACILNRTIPPLTEENIELWRRIEIAKHRLIYSLLRLGLAVAPRQGAESPGLAFDFLADLSPDQKVMTGHNEGLITLNISEADEANRTRSKLDLGEKYRTLLGHFRHETGHYYWDVYIRDQGNLEKFRSVFGDEQQDYEASLKAYYEKGPPADWMENFISPYASAHPWEDWAESWSHYLHMLDTLETAYYFGVSVNPKRTADNDLMSAEIDKDPYSVKSFDRVFKMWLPITFAVNSLNRSMGHQDFYPFVVAPGVIRKMAFIHDLRKMVAKNA